LNLERRRLKNTTILLRNLKTNLDSLNTKRTLWRLLFVVDVGMKFLFTSIWSKEINKVVNMTSFV
jgi:hypothetical protein